MNIILVKLELILIFLNKIPNLNIIDKKVVRMIPSLN